MGYGVADNGMKSLLGGLTAALIPRASGAPPVPYMGRSLYRSASPLVGSLGAYDAYASNSTLFPMVSRIASAVGGTEWHLYRSAKSGKKEDRVEVTSHYALDLMRKPNSFVDGPEFWESFQQHIELVGESIIVVERGPIKTIPMGLWVVRPDRMTPVPDRQKFLSGWIYVGPDGEKVPLDTDQVIQQKLPNPTDPYRGLGPVQSAMMHIDSARYSAQWNRNFFLNNASPSGIIELPGELGDTEFDEFAMRWREQHQGVSNAHRVAILEQGAKWVEAGTSQRDMQFVELSNLSRDFIREALGFPKSMLGATDDVNRATAEAGEYIFGKWLIDPRCARIRGMLNGRYNALFGSTTDGLEWDFETHVPDNQELENATLTARAQAANVLVGAGYDPVEVLQAVGLPDMARAVPAPPPGQDGAAAFARDVVAALRPLLDGQRRESARMTAAATEVPPPAYPAGEPAGGAPRELPADETPDISPAKAAVAAALAALMVTWLGLMGAAKDALVAQVRHLAADGRLDELATALHVDASRGADALYDAMTTLGAEAGRHVVEEAARQGMHLGAVAPAAGELRTVANVTADLLVSELRTTAARAALAAHGPNVPADDVAQAARDALDGLSDAGPTKQLGGALHGALHAGRVATLRAGPVGALYGAEMNDSNTCRPCREVDGRWLCNTDDLAPLALSYPAGAFGGYIHCQGGVNCRGTVVGVWRPDTV